MLGAFLLNIIASIISKDWRLIAFPKTRPGWIIVLFYNVASIALSLLTLLKQTSALWTIIFIIGGQIVWQLYTAAPKFFLTKHLRGSPVNGHASPQH